MPLQLEFSIRALLGRILRVLSLRLKRYAAGSTNALFAALRLLSRFFKPSGDGPTKRETKDGFQTASLSTCAPSPYQMDRGGSLSSASIVPSMDPHVSVSFSTNTAESTPLPSEEAVLQPLLPRRTTAAPTNPLTTTNLVSLSVNPSPITPLSSRDPSRHFGPPPPMPKPPGLIENAMVLSTQVAQLAPISAVHLCPLGERPAGRSLKPIHAGEFKRYERDRLRYAVNIEGFLRGFLTTRTQERCRS